MEDNRHQQEPAATSHMTANITTGTFELVAVEEKDRAEIAELTKDVYDGEDYWLHCITPWKTSESLLDTDDKTGATYAHGLRLHSVAEDAGQLIALNAVQFVNNTFCWCMALRVSPEHRGKGAGSRVFRHGLDWAKQRHGVKTFAMSTVSVNHASLAIGNKFGFKIAPEWNQVAMKRSFSTASSLLTGPGADLIVSKPSMQHELLRRLVSIDAAANPQCLISTSWAYAPVNQHSLETFLDPCCQLYSFSAASQYHSEAVLIEQAACPSFIRDGPKHWDNGTIEFWWTVCASNEDAARELIQARQRQLSVYKTSHSKIRISLFIPPRLVKAATSLKWSDDPKSSFLLHCLILNSE
eukprot:TRINITY_DN8622_c1_g1_i1.p1 TRINITY_DN8622_c1_g1~~TRINITY_DN8622_c1_g1_i1.p1  ORF type:complete len:354 (+),score=42.64 TRINITY_DN8622_c1_g1_i1:127-1188(+)